MSKIENLSNYQKFKTVFLEANSKLNLISKNDEIYLYEKHFYDSLCIKLFFEKYNYMPQSILDIGTGGGFPAIPIAMEYPDINVYGVDSIRKKILAVEGISENLNLKNLTLINERVENLENMTFDVVTSRAVGKISKIVQYAYSLLNKGGYIVLYKSKLVNDEIDEAKNLIRKYKLKIEPIITYDLPLNENFTRNLVILKK